MREQVPHTLWLSVMPHRAQLDAVDAAQEARDIAEHEVARCMANRNTPEGRDQLAFWQEELKRAERVYQAAVAAQPR